MIPVDQEFVHLPEKGQIGDCQRAVLASLFELPLSEVPHFLQESGGDVEKFHEGVQAFCNSRGFAYLTIPGRAGAAFFGDSKKVYHEISGPSPRGNGTYHAVVGCDGEIVFDPHPSRAGLAGDPADWDHCYLVPITKPVAYQGASEREKRAYWHLMKFAVSRYLMSNTVGRASGAQKAYWHTELCTHYLAPTLGCDTSEVRRLHEALYQKVHSKTQALTDHLDTMIGFPLDSRPDYFALEPLFFDKFFSLCEAAMAEGVC